MCVQSRPKFTVRVASDSLQSVVQAQADDVATLCRVSQSVRQ
jgi:hypothetical protein